MQYEIATTREPWKKKADGKLKKYQQLALEIRERQPGFEITVVTVMIGALGGCLKKTISNVLRILSKLEIVIQTVPEIQKTILLKSETVTSNIRTSPNGKTSTIKG